MDTFRHSRYFNASTKTEIYDQKQTGSCGRRIRHYGEPLGVIPIRRRGGGVEGIPFQSFEIFNVEIVCPVGEELKNA